MESNRKAEFTVNIRDIAADRVSPSGVSMDGEILVRAYYTGEKHESCREDAIDLVDELHEAIDGILERRYGEEGDDE